MEDKISLNAGNLKEAFVKVQFNGKRDINGMIDNWFGLHNGAAEFYKNILIIDSMEGEISTEGICLLLEILSEHNICSNKKVAVVLTRGNSYNSRFFDIFARNWSIHTKHFIQEEDAVDWLDKK